MQHMAVPQILRHRFSLLYVAQRFTIDTPRLLTMRTPLRVAKGIVMRETKQEVIDALEKEALKLRYLAETEDKAGLSEILMDISINISCIKFAECLKTDDGGDQNGKTD